MDRYVPIIPIRDGIIFPNTDSVLTFGRPKSLIALENSFSQERIVAFVLQKNARVNDPNPEELYTVGTLCRIERMIKSEGEINAQVRGISRVKILQFKENNSYLLGRIEELGEQTENSPEIKALSNHLTNEFRRAMNLGNRYLCLEPSRRNMRRDSNPQTTSRPLVLYARNEGAKCPTA